MRGESCGGSSNENSCAHGAQINFGDLTSYLTYLLGTASSIWRGVFLLKFLSYLYGAGTHGGIRTHATDLPQVFY
jgi:hypothetical protein